MKIWDSKRTKLRFCKSKALSTLLYSCETWHLKTNQQINWTPLTTNAFGMKRSVLETSEEIRDRTKQRPVSGNVCKRCLSWLGHVSRLSPSPSANHTFHGTPAGRRGRSGLKMNWHQIMDRLPVRQPTME